MPGRTARLVACLFAMTATPVLALAPANDAPAGAPYVAPRTPDGRPDLQGEWTNLTRTPFQRPRDFAGPIATPFEAAVWSAKTEFLLAGRTLPTRPGAPPPKPDVGESEWYDAGVGLMRIEGKPRSAIITDPVSGRLPYNVIGRRLVTEAIRRDQTAFDNPEDRLAGERCLMGTTGPLAPPMTPPLYNAGYQILQTPGFVVIETEMVHDLRIIPLASGASTGAHIDGPPRWFGDSIGHWEGDTLVVETVNQHPLSAEHYIAGDAVVLISPAARVVERFTRTSPTEIRYAFTVEDPAFYSRPWSGELVFRTATQPLYEYACHEGNYALANILRGARHKEQEDAAAKAKAAVAGP